MGVTALYLNGVVNVRVRALRLRNSVRGVYIDNSSGIELEECGPTATVIRLSGGIILRDDEGVCGGVERELRVVSPDHHSTIWENGVLWENGSGVLAHYPMTIRNSVIRQTGEFGVWGGHLESQMGITTSSI